MPTLRQLIGHLDSWPSEDERADAETWLETHGDTVDWCRLTAATGYDELASITMPSGASLAPQPDDLVHAVTPAELLAAWEFEFGPAPTDLTDAEWSLLEQHIGPGNDHQWGGHHRTLRELASKRRTFDAVRFKSAHQMSWSKLPARYGPWSSNYQLYRRYQAEGLFVRLRDALKDNPDAAVLVAWLSRIIGTGLLDEHLDGGQHEI